MRNKKDRIYSFRQLVPEMINMNEEHKAFDAEQRKIQRYYKAYKKMEYFRDMQISIDDNIYEEDKDMVVSNMKKIWENSDYVDFINKANKKDFGMLDFLKMMEDPNNEKIFKDLYLDALHQLDYEYYNADYDEIEKYIKQVYSQEINKDYIQATESIELLYESLSMIRDVDIRSHLLKQVDDALHKVSIEMFKYINEESYMQKLMAKIPELRFKTQIEELPDYLLEKYKSINGEKDILISELLGFGYHEDNITDEVLDEIVDGYYKNLEEINKEKAEIMDKIEAIFD